MPAVLCSKCACDLPDGAQFCLKCGEPVKTDPVNVLPVTTATLGCSKCGTTLPDGAEFCPKCGKPVSIPAKNTKPAPASGSIDSIPVEPTPIEPPAQPASRSLIPKRVVLLLLLGIFLAAVAWAASSDNPFAQGIQELVGWKHDQSILETPFFVSAHNFRYYKFALPEGSMHVSIVGEFSASGDNRNSSLKDKEADNSVEVYVLSEPAFTVWQNGYATSSVYESGRVSSGNVQADLPAGAGIYYLVFSNKFASRTPKNIKATFLLRYKNWVPESLRSAKDRFWNWVGL